MKAQWWKWTPVETALRTYIIQCTKYRYRNNYHSKRHDGFGVSELGRHRTGSDKELNTETWTKWPKLCIRQIEIRIVERKYFRCNLVLKIQLIISHPWFKWWFGDNRHNLNRWWPCSLMHIQSCTIMMRFNITWYYVYHCSDYDRIPIRVWIHKIHPIRRPNERAMGCLLWGICRKLTAI